MGGFRKEAVSDVSFLLTLIISQEEEQFNDKTENTESEWCENKEWWKGHNANKFVI